MTTPLAVFLHKAEKLPFNVRCFFSPKYSYGHVLCISDALLKIFREHRKIFGLRLDKWIERNVFIKKHSRQNFSGEIVQCGFDNGAKKFLTKGRFFFAQCPKVLILYYFSYWGRSLSAFVWIQLVLFFVGPESVHPVVCSGKAVYWLHWLKISCYLWSDLLFYLSHRR